MDGTHVHMRVVMAVISLNAPTLVRCFGGLPDIPTIPDLPDVPDLPSTDQATGMLSNAAGWVGDKASDAGGTVSDLAQQPCDPAAVTAMQVACGASSATACSSSCLAAFEPLALQCPVSLRAELCGCAPAENHPVEFVPE